MRLVESKKKYVIANNMGTNMEIKADLYQHVKYEDVFFIVSKKSIATQKSSKDFIAYELETGQFVSLGKTVEILFENIDQMIRSMTIEKFRERRDFFQPKYNQSKSDF